MYLYTKNSLSSQHSHRIKGMKERVEEAKRANTECMNISHISAMKNHDLNFIYLRNLICDLL